MIYLPHYRRRANHQQRIKDEHKHPEVLILQSGWPNSASICKVKGGTPQTQACCWPSDRVLEPVRLLCCWGGGGAGVSLMVSLGPCPI